MFQSLVEGIMVGVMKYLSYYQDNKDILKNKIDKLKESQEFLEKSGSRAGSKERVRGRIKIVEEIFKPS